MRAIPIKEAAKEVWIRHAREEGKEEGMEAEKVEIARNFLKMGLPVEQIARGTGLSVKEISGLK